MTKSERSRRFEESVTEFLISEVNPDNCDFGCETSINLFTGKANGGLNENLIKGAGGDEAALGDAMHAYAEGVGFAHGFKGLSNKTITDDQIDDILDLLLAPENGTVESFKFLNDATLLNNLDQIIEDIQTIYGFTDEEVASFYVNDPS